MSPRRSSGREGHEGRAASEEISVGNRTAYPPRCEDTLGRPCSPGTQYAGTLNMDLKTLNAVRNKYLLFILFLMQSEIFCNRSPNRLVRTLSLESRAQSAILRASDIAPSAGQFSTCRGLKPALPDSWLLDPWS